MSDSDTMSNGDKLIQERAHSFANIRMPLERVDDMAGGELPFIVAVIDDFSGNASTKERAELSERTFDKVSKLTLDQKIEEVAPGLNYDVKATLPGSASETLNVNLSFKSMKDFEPKSVANNIPELKRLLQLREQIVKLKQRAQDPSIRRELEKFIAAIVPPEV